MGAWTDCLERPRRRPWHLLLNVEVNMFLAASALLDHLLEDVHDEACCAVEGLVSYQLVHNLVVDSLRKARPCSRYQFKVVLAIPGEGESEDVLISPNYTRMAEGAHPWP